MPMIIRQGSLYMAVYQWRVEAASRCQGFVFFCKDLLPLSGSSLFA